MPPRKPRKPRLKKDSTPKEVVPLDRSSSPTQSTSTTMKEEKVELGRRKRTTKRRATSTDAEKVPRKRAKSATKRKEGDPPPVKREQASYFIWKFAKNSENKTWMEASKILKAHFDKLRKKEDDGPDDDGIENVDLTEEKLGDKELNSLIEIMKSLSEIYYKYPALLKWNHNSVFNSMLKPSNYAFRLAVNHFFEEFLPFVDEKYTRRVSDALPLFLFEKGHQELAKAVYNKLIANEPISTEMKMNIVILLLKYKKEELNIDCQSVQWEPIRIKKDGKEEEEMYAGIDGKMKLSRFGKNCTQYPSLKTRPVLFAKNLIPGLYQIPQLCIPSLPEKTIASFEWKEITQQYDKKITSDIHSLKCEDCCKIIGHFQIFCRAMKTTPDNKRKCLNCVTFKIQDGFLRGARLTLDRFLNPKSKKKSEKKATNTAVTKKPEPRKTGRRKIATRKSKKKSKKTERTLGETDEVHVTDHDVNLDVLSPANTYSDRDDPTPPVQLLSEVREEPLLIDELVRRDEKPLLESSPLVKEGVQPDGEVENGMEETLCDDISPPEQLISGGEENLKLSEKDGSSQVLDTNGDEFAFEQMSRGETPESSPISNGGTQSEDEIEKDMDEVCLKEKDTSGENKVCEEMEDLESNIEKIQKKTDCGVHTEVALDDEKTNDLNGSPASALGGKSHETFQENDADMEGLQETETDNCAVPAEERAVEALGDESAESPKAPHEINSILDFIDDQPSDDAEKDDGSTALKKAGSPKEASSPINQAVTTLEGDEIKDLINQSAAEAATEGTGQEVKHSLSDQHSGYTLKSDELDDPKETECLEEAGSPVTLPVTKDVDMEDLSRDSTPRPFNVQDDDAGDCNLQEYECLEKSNSAVSPLPDQRSGSRQDGDDSDSIQESKCLEEAVSAVNSPVTNLEEVDMEDLSNDSAPRSFTVQDDDAGDCNLQETECLEKPSSVVVPPVTTEDVDMEDLSSGSLQEIENTVDIADAPLSSNLQNICDDDIDLPKTMDLSRGLLQDVDSGESPAPETISETSEEIEDKTFDFHDPSSGNIENNDNVNCDLPEADCLETPYSAKTEQETSLGKDAAETVSNESSSENTQENNDYSGLQDAEYLEEPNRPMDQTVTTSDDKEMEHRRNGSSSPSAVRGTSQEMENIKDNADVSRSFNVQDADVGDRNLQEYECLEKQNSAVSPRPDQRSDNRQDGDDSGSIQESEFLEKAVSAVNSPVTNLEEVDMEDLSRDSTPRPFNVQDDDAGDCNLQEYECLEKPSSAVSPSVTAWEDVNMEDISQGALKEIDSSTDIANALPSSNYQNDGDNVGNLQENENLEKVDSAEDQAVTKLPDDGIENVNDEATAPEVIPGTSEDIENGVRDSNDPSFENAQEDHGFRVLQETGCLEEPINFMDQTVTELEDVEMEDLNDGPSAQTPIGEMLQDIDCDQRSGSRQDGDDSVSIHKSECLEEAVSSVNSPVTNLNEVVMEDLSSDPALRSFNVQDDDTGDCNLQETKCLEKPNSVVVPPVTTEDVDMEDLSSGSLQEIENTVDIADAPLSSFLQNIREDDIDLQEAVDSKRKGLAAGETTPKVEKKKPEENKLTAPAAIGDATQESNPSANSADASPRAIAQDDDQTKGLQKTGGSESVVNRTVPTLAEKKVEQVSGESTASKAIQKTTKETTNKTRESLAAPSANAQNNSPNLERQRIRDHNDRNDRIDRMEAARPQPVRVPNFLEDDAPDFLEQLLEERNPPPPPRVTPNYDDRRITFPDPTARLGTPDPIQQAEAWHQQRVEESQPPLWYEEPQPEEDEYAWWNLP